MNLPFRIEKKESFHVVGYAVKTTNQKKAGRKAIAQLWENVKKQKLDETLLCMSNHNPNGLFGLSVYNVDEADSRKFWYYIAISTEEQPQKDMECYVVPERTWAIFPCTIETIGKVEGQAITKWLPKSGYRPLNSGYLSGRMKSGAPDIECYKSDGTVEVWIAVEKK